MTNSIKMVNSFVTFLRENKTVLVPMAFVELVVKQAAKEGIVAFGGALNDNFTAQYLYCK